MAEGVTSIVVLPDAGFGDIITALPAVDKLTEQGPLYLVVFEHRIRSLLPWSDLIRHPGDMRDPWQDFKGIALSIHICVGKYGKKDHPVRMYFEQAGLPMPDGVPQPRIVVSGEAPIYDFVLAPWSHEPDRTLPPEQSSQLVCDLRNRYPTDSFAILGAPDSPEIPRVEGHKPGSVTYHYGMDFRDVGRMMMNARKAVITVDSFPNRLAHSTGIDNHILLASEVTPEYWATHPKCRLIYGRSSWTFDNIVRQIER